MKRFYIGGLDNPYMIRWFVIPRNPWFNIYLHKFCRDDDDRALHDHPWWFISIMLKGSYIEHRSGKPSLIRHALSFAFRPAVAQHRIELFRDDHGAIIPCWTLVITGRKKRTWGFWCPKGFVPWHEFVEHSDAGNVGKGCE
jgi:hypothetical protein